MRNIIITTNHLAPYFDRLIDYLNEFYQVETFYHYKNISEKGFKYNDSYKFNYYADYSLYKKFKIFKKADLVIFGGWNILENIILAITLYIFTRTKVVYTTDFPDPEVTRESFFLKKIKKLIFYFSNGLFTASYSCKEYFKNNYNIRNNKLFVFPYTHSNNIEGIETINTKRIESLTNNDKISILIANRFIKRKGYDVVYKAIKELDNNNLLDQFEIRILGTGAEMEEYKALFAKYSNIIIHGWVDYSIYESMINHCDILIHASHFEPFGIPPIDALARGKFLIVTDKVMSLNFLKNKNFKGIYFYDSHDYIDLFNALKIKVLHKEEIYKYSENNMKIVNEFYCYEEYLTVINSVL